MNKQIGNELFKHNYNNFYENMYKIKKKSVYVRKYHIINVLDEISLYNKKQIPSFVFNNVSKIKRIISVKHSIHRLFIEWGIDFEIEITKSNKTLKYYEEYIMRTKSQH